VSDDSLRQFASAYDAHRVEDQMRFYNDRTARYERADSQAGLTSEILLGLAGICGIVAAASPSLGLWLGVVAVALAAGAAIVGSWAELIGFSKNSELYGAAAASIRHIRPRRPGQGPIDEDQVEAYMQEVESVLLGEVQSWGKQWGQPAAPE